MSELPKLPAGVIKLASAIVADNDFASLPILADAMEDAGDCRHIAVRKHSQCCFRGMGIAKNIEWHGECYDADAMQAEALRTQVSPNPEEWSCCK